MIYFFRKKEMQLNLLKKQNVKNSKQLNSILYFLGHKFKYNINTKLGFVLNAVFGISIKKFIFYFLSLVGYSYNYGILVISVYIFQKLQLIIRTLFLNYELRKYISYNILVQKRLKLYSGMRHTLFLPVRGQRTKTNAGTQKQKKKSSNSDQNKRSSKRKK